jgi:UDP-N-acetylmuramyl pentapeptide synthase
MLAFNFYAEKPVIAITGSAGKTMVKTMVSAILRERWVVFESKDYYNTVDKTLGHVNEIDFIHRAVVLEYGMAFPGAISEHCQIIQPNIGVITNVGLAHIGNFEGKVELLAAAKSELIKGMNPLGILLINADDPNSKLLHTRDYKGKILTVGIKSEADYIAKNIAYSQKGMTFTLILKGKEYSFQIPIFGEHNIYNALFLPSCSNHTIASGEHQEKMCDFPGNWVDQYTERYNNQVFQLPLSLLCLIRTYECLKILLSS